MFSAKSFRLDSFLACLLVSIFACSGSLAAVFINVYEVGSDIEVTYNGSINLTGLSFDFAATSSGLLGGKLANNRLSNFGSGTTAVSTRTFTGLTSFPTSLLGDDFYFPASSVGTNGFGVQTILSGGVAEGRVSVPAGYLSNDPILATQRFENASFAAINLTPGIYNWVWSSDFVRVNVGAVPEPTTAALCLGSILCFLRRKRI